RQKLLMMNLLICMVQLNHQMFKMLLYHQFLLAVEWFFTINLLHKAELLQRELQLELRFQQCFSALLLLSAH
ncbi:hypothetical protein DLY41_14025, partial [Escherichia coli]|nr:hypothetical protein [Escherichia coli]